MSTDLAANDVGWRRDAFAERLREPLLDLLAAGCSFSDISVEELVSRGRMARSTFYAYFSDKGELLLAVNAPARADVTSATEALWAVEPVVSRGAFTGSVSALVDAWDANRPLIRAVIECSAADSNLRSHVTATRERFCHLCAAHIRACQAAGQLRAGVHPAATAKWIAFMIERGLTQTTDECTPEETVALADMLWSVLHD